MANASNRVNEIDIEMGDRTKSLIDRVTSGDIKGANDENIAEAKRETIVIIESKSGDTSTITPTRSGAAITMKPEVQEQNNKNNFCKVVGYIQRKERHRPKFHSIPIQTTPGCFNYDLVYG